MEPTLLTEANHAIGAIGKIIEIFGIITILLGGIAATYRFFKEVRIQTSPKAYENYRSALGRAILLGLEFLVGGDIIGTVAVEPTFRSLGVLSLIVIIRTFLSFSLEVEIKGHWPWQSEKAMAANDTEPRESQEDA
jgi:uncharacterized membrane protein